MAKLCGCGQPALERRGVCRDCRCKRRKQLRAKDPDEGNRKHREWYHKNKERQSSRSAEYREANREQHREYWKKADAKRRAAGYFNSDEHRAANRRYAQEWRKRPENKERLRAASMVSAALYKGALIRPTHCECGSSDRIEAHHDNYGKPLEVRWLCKKCHMRHHGKTLHQ